MKKYIFILSVFIPIQIGWTQIHNRSAIIEATCRSFYMSPFILYIPGFGYNTTYITTYDGVSGMPYRHPTEGGYYFSGEIRPRAGQSAIYEADYISYNPDDQIDEYGYFLLNIPTTDLDSNGFPDFLQFSNAANVSITGSGRSDWPTIGWPIRTTAASD